MRKVIVQIDISLDGYAARANGKTDWISANEAMNTDALTLLGSVDTILLGRNAYHDFAGFWPFSNFDPATTIGKIADRINQSDKVVFSKTLSEVTWGQWNNARLASGDLEEEIKRLKALPGTNMILWAGVSIIVSFIALGLVDHMRLRVHPILLGTGRSIYPKQTIEKKLTLIASHAYENGVVMLDYLR